MELSQEPNENSPYLVRGDDDIDAGPCHPVADLQRLPPGYRFDGARTAPRIPQIGAHKDFEPEEENEEKSLRLTRRLLLDQALSSRREALAWPRWSQLKTLLRGIWDERDNIVVVGKGGQDVSQFFGTPLANGAGFSLLPEEALFLLEAGSLRVTTECHEKPCPLSSSPQIGRGIPFSLEDAYVAFTRHPSRPLTLDRYKVYGHLARAGYVVVPHRSDATFTVYERRIGLDLLSRPTTMDEPLATMATTQTAADDGVEAAGGIDLAGVHPATPSNAIVAPSETLVDADEPMDEDLDSPRLKDADAAASSSSFLDSIIPHPIWSEDDLRFPSIFSSSISSVPPDGLVELVSLDLNRLPFDEWTNGFGKTSWRWDEPTSSERWIRDEKIRASGVVVKPKWRRKRRWRPWTPDDGKPCRGAGEREEWETRIHRVSKSWAELKALTTEERRSLSQRRPPHLWDPSFVDETIEEPSHASNPSFASSEDFVTPLADPRTTATVDDLFERLDVVRTFDESTSGSKEEEEEEESRFEIVYDVYVTNKNYSKTHRGSPNYRVCLQDSGAASSSFSEPTPREMALLNSRSRDGVPLLWASVSSDGVAFHCFFDVELPFAPVSLGDGV